MKRLEEIRRFEEDEGLELGEEGDAEFTDTSTDEGEGEAEQMLDEHALCESGVLSPVAERSSRGRVEKNGRGVIERSGVIEGGGDVIEENGGCVEGSSKGDQLAVEETTAPLNDEVDDGSSFADESDAEQGGTLGSDDLSPSRKRRRRRRKRVLDSGDECEGLPQVDTSSRRASPGREGSPKSTLTAFSQVCVALVPSPRLMAGSLPPTHTPHSHPCSRTCSVMHLFWTHLRLCKVPPTLPVT